MTLLPTRRRARWAWAAAAGLALLLVAAAPRAVAQQASDPGNGQAANNGVLVNGVPAADKATAKKLRAEDNVALIGHRNVGGGLDFYSKSKESALGQSLAAQVLQESKVVSDPVVNEYINRLAQNLGRNSDAQFPITVHVLQDDTINAFTLPGGFIFVNSGLILSLQEEDELAGAIAHEIGHVAARHGTRNATKGDLMQILAIPAVIAAGPGLAGLGAEEAASAAIPLQYEKFSRGAEQEADWLGVQYLWKSGYDPQGMARAFEILNEDEKEKPGLLSRMFASHPQTPDRVALTEKEIATILPPHSEYEVTTSEFDRVKARLRALLKSKIETGVTIPGGVVAAPPAPTKPVGPPVIKH